MLNRPEQEWVVTATAGRALQAHSVSAEQERARSQPLIARRSREPTPQPAEPSGLTRPPSRSRLQDAKEVVDRNLLNGLGLR